MLVHRSIPPRNSTTINEISGSPSTSLSDLNTPVDDKPKKRPTLLEKWRNPLQPDNESVAPMSTTVADIFWIIRPFVYLLAYASHGEKSWWPVALSASMDFLSWRFHKPSRQLNKLERDELAKRFRQAVVFYLFRPPISDLLFGKLDTLIDNPLALKVPGMKAVLSFLNEILKFYRNRYFYTAVNT